MKKTAEEILKKNCYRQFTDDGGSECICLGLSEAVSAIHAYHEQGDGWVRVEDGLPERPDFYWVYRTVLSTYTDGMDNDVYEREQEKIYYFKEANVTGWQNDWTGKPSDVTHWQPLPSPPKQ